MNEQPESGGDALEGGHYEVLHARLVEASRDLAERTQQLNLRRKKLFGALDYELLQSERITTHFNCVPRDMVPIGDLFLFGYNVHMGLKTTTELKDVLSVYRFKDEHFHEEKLEVLLNDERFHVDFDNLYKYYRSSTFSKFSIRPPFLFMNFQTGKTFEEFKSFKWTLNEDQLQYNDNRSDREFKYPDQHDFVWKRTHRDLHINGEFPHISIEDRIFVETIGGDLTIKVEDNTEVGQGIYEEAVEHVDQTLDDAEIYYAIVDNIILLKIRPYQEKDFRTIAYCEKTQQAYRIDAIQDSCVLLPESHGIAFPGGYLLQTGTLTTFDHGLEDLILDKVIVADNGEDYIYVYYEPNSGTYLLHPYNLVDQSMDAPMACHGFSMFGDGKLVLFKSENNPQKQHTLQVWQTPFAHEHLQELKNDLEPSDAFLSKLGNKEIVRRLAECREIASLAEKDESYAGLFLDIVQCAKGLLEDCFWLNKSEVGDLSEPLQTILATATTAMDEFEKVRQLKLQHQQQTDEVLKATKQLFKDLQQNRYENVEDFVDALQTCRRQRGELITLKDLKYSNKEVIAQAEEELIEQSDKMSEACIGFLQDENALKGYVETIEELDKRTTEVQLGVEAKPIAEDIKKCSSNLELLTDIIANLKIEDPTKSAAILENISSIYAKLNQVKAALRNRQEELAMAEGAVEFSAQLKLLDQSLSSSLEIAEDEQDCEEALSKTMVKLEELEGKFGEVEAFIEQLSDKRNSVLEAFESKKSILLEARQRKTQALISAAERILSGIRSRLARQKTIEELQSTFASDIMVEKARNVAQDLRNYGDTVKADEIETNLKTILEDSIRQLRDQLDLYGEGGDTIQLGKHTFSVNRQKLELSIVNRSGVPHFHLGGTDYFEEIQDEGLESTKEVWQQEVISETEEVYRSEYLAYCYQMLLPEEFEKFSQYSEEEQLQAVSKFALPRNKEAYSKGIHDVDAQKILSVLSALQKELGPMVGTFKSRSLARWTLLVQADLISQKGLSKAAQDHALIQKTLTPKAKTSSSLWKTCFQLVSQQMETLADYDSSHLQDAASYLLYLLSHPGKDHCSSEVLDHLKIFDRQLQLKCELRSDWVDQYEMMIPLIVEWAHNFLVEHGAETGDVVYELASLFCRQQIHQIEKIEVNMHQSLSDFKGRHAVIENGNYEFDADHFMDKCRRFHEQRVPLFEQYESAKKEVLRKKVEEIRLDELKPKVLSSFVRNKLINDVYLPMIGDNLAKQISTVGEGKRTDLMGLLLLISPPGYGKTTLMEYVSDRLGLTFVKINGPTIGHRVLSLDPQEAPNASSASELLKLNFSLEMGNNIMLYLDDIQHLNPEFLQKFISLCDGQRRIEGVYRGSPKTYDFRGKKVAVVMAGNPYTESGDKFQIPDMLANRADTYNLGDILGGHGDAFKLSYIENSLTSNRTLAPLTQCSKKALYSFVKAAEKNDPEAIDSEANFTPSQIEDMLKVIRYLIQIRDVVLSANLAYIASAAQDDRDRVEPPFKLQGSYRNMNRMVEKVVPIMNDDEIKALIIDHYQNESQTLTDGAEANFLKFKSMMNWLTPEEEKRWQWVTQNFKKQKSLFQVDQDDPLAPILNQFTMLNEQIENIGRNIVESKEIEVEKPVVDVPAALPELKVVNKIPTAFTKVLTSQFKLMEGWMKPLLKTELTQSKDISDLKDLLISTHENYKVLMEQLIKDNPKKTNQLKKKLDRDN